MLTPDKVGLCWDCAFQRRTGNRRGSIFYFCEKSKDDRRFPKYPPLPVLACAGYESRGEDPWEKFAQTSNDGE